ncbi:hypothetical protein B296_00005544 [Ensete ventricosum]|uniref:Uncharacterized protein n=1 Tax=Ensete ventricosum TaxID=4639 RepID=A0A426ZGD9_ENSVE|nr:hypothetical protein B296_00005544 [Ensete ventricosum]
MEIRPSWEEALAFPAGKKAGELEVDEEDIEEKDVESCCSKDWWDERLDSTITEVVLVATMKVRKWRPWQRGRWQDQWSEEDETK